MIRDSLSPKRMLAAAVPLAMFAGVLATCLAAPRGAATGLLLILPHSVAASGALVASPAGAPSIFSPDKGRLRISIKGQAVGSEDFEISPSGEAWLERSSMTAQAPGGPEIKATGQLTLSADGIPLHYDWAAQAQKKATGTVEFTGETAKCFANLGGASPLRKDFTFSSPHVAVLDNNLYYQFGVLAREYDWQAGGKQTFPVLIPQDMVPGTISVESLGKQAAGGGNYEALLVSTPDLEIKIFLDGNRRLMRIEVPASDAVIERQ
jgi:hypothetical protein